MPPATTVGGGIIKPSSEEQDRNAGNSCVACSGGLTEVTTDTIDRGVWGFGTFFADTRHTTD